MVQEAAATAAETIQDLDTPAHTPAMLTPALEYRKTALVVPGEIPAGADAAVDSLVGMYQRRGAVLRALRRDAEAIGALAPPIRSLPDEQLRQLLQDCRTAFRRNGRDCRQMLPTGLAAIREAADRKTGMRPYPVQIMGALALNRGCLIEMATGEGKTLVAGLAAVLAGWTRNPCQIVTVNDYLAQRDAEWLEHLYRFCGLSVGYVTGQMEPADRRHGYDQDITYTTGKEILADFLRDRLRFGTMQNASSRHIRYSLLSRDAASVELGTVMRGLHTAIVDEADSILIDEAVTPLIISHVEPNSSLEDACRTAQETAETLEQGRHYRVDLRYREVELTEQGHREVVERAGTLDGIWCATQRWVELVEQALTAREFFKRDQQYIVQDDRVVIVDEFTGRLMPMRTWRHGLHQAIEAKEGIEISSPSETLSRLSFQRFFRFFRCLAGMTGTARESARELWRVYRLPVVAIPTNRPCQRRVYPDRVFLTEAEKWDAITEEIVNLHHSGRPMLIGTRSVRASETLARRLRERDLGFNLLNAIHHGEEARIVAEAGLQGRITIATNMAGRGTDIKLGPGVAGIGGLHVLATERHESGRVDRQLFGRSARQGDPGSAQAFLSLEDELFLRFLPGQWLRQWLMALVHVRYPGSRMLTSRMVRCAQFNAQRQASKQRRSVLKMDTWIDDSLAFTPSSDRVD